MLPDKYTSGSVSVFELLDSSEYIQMSPRDKQTINVHDVCCFVHGWQLIPTLYPLGTRRCCDVESTSMTLIQRRNHDLVFSLAMTLSWFS